LHKQWAQSPYKCVLYERFFLPASWMVRVWLLRSAATFSVSHHFPGRSLGLARAVADWVFCIGCDWKQSSSIALVLHLQPHLQYAPALDQALSLRAILSCQRRWPDDGFYALLHAQACHNCSWDVLGDCQALWLLASDVNWSFPKQSRAIAIVLKVRVCHTCKLLQTQGHAYWPSASLSYFPSAEKAITLCCKPEAWSPQLSRQSWICKICNFSTSKCFPLVH
jgi:hypothetical protein